MIKVIGISDLHGYLPPITEEFDLLLIGGDICPAHSHYYYFQRMWLATDFVKWVNELPYKDEWSKVIFIGGNHDCYLDQEPNPNKGDFSSIYTDILKPCGGRLIYLEDDEYTFEKMDDDGQFETLKIYGTPWCKIFGNWWFMRNDEFLEKAFDAIPEDLDILLTHDAPAMPPHGIISVGGWKGTDAGNKILAEAIKKKKPKYVLYGHIHSSSHELSDEGGTKVACLSLIDERYEPAYPPLVLEIEGHKSAKDGGGIKISPYLCTRNKKEERMKIYNLVVLGDNWVSSTPYINLDDAVNEVNKMVEGQKYLEGSDKVDVHEIKDYEMLCLPIRLDCGEKKYAVETRSLFRGEITTMWRVVYEQEVK